jgi:hypothetical protein
MARRLDRGMRRGLAATVLTRNTRDFAMTPVRVEAY